MHIIARCPRCSYRWWLDAAAADRIVIAERPRAEELRRQAARAREMSDLETELVLDDVPLFEVAKRIGKLAGVPVLVDRALWEPEHPRVTLSTGPRTLERALRMLDVEIDAAHLLTGEAIFLLRR